MDPRVFLGLLVEGAKTNFWSLACPAYCQQQPSIGLLGFVFLVGLLTGLCLAVVAAARLFGFWPLVACPSPSNFHSLSSAPANPAPSRAQLIASYLHEPRFRQQSRRG